MCVSLQSIHGKIKEKFIQDTFLFSSRKIFPTVSITEPTSPDNDSYFVSRPYDSPRQYLPLLSYSVIVLQYLGNNLQSTVTSLGLRNVKIPDTYRWIPPTQTTTLHSLSQVNPLSLVSH